MKRSLSRNAVVCCVLTLVLIQCEKEQPTNPAPANSVPVIALPSSQTVFAHQSYHLELVANDADSDQISWQIHGNPPASTFNAQAGVLSWHPTPTDTGSYQMSITATDGTDTVSHALTIDVEHTAVSPAKPLSLLAPKGGEMYRVGDTMKIAWYFDVTVSDYLNGVEFYLLDGLGDRHIIPMFDTNGTPIEQIDKMHAYYDGNSPPTSMLGIYRWVISASVLHELNLNEVSTVRDDWVFEILCPYCVPGFYRAVSSDFISIMSAQ
ncbi:MAG: hypothetical protein GF398_21580 [Chitinivibrionales bacterium]|nr:hypothetical protein [Chitinivibrionales bacterium]